MLPHLSQVLFLLLDTMMSYVPMQWYHIYVLKLANNCPDAPGQFPESSAVPLATSRCAGRIAPTTQYTPTRSAQFSPGIKKIQSNYRGSILKDILYFRFPKLQDCTIPQPQVRSSFQGKKYKRVKSNNLQIRSVLKI